MKKIAVVGGGISGLVAAYRLSARHRVVLHEREADPGGHTHTVSVERPEGSWHVDTGFIVYNDRTYPEFIALLNELGITGQPAPMGFSVHCRESGLEYSGSGLGGFFADRRNLFSWQHWRMLGEILRFNRTAPRLLDHDDGNLALGEYLEREGYSEAFQRYYILAMGGAIWSCGEARIADFPAGFFVRFLAHHGLLQLRGRPLWRVVPGGSVSYVRALRAAMSAEVRTSTPVQAVQREGSGVRVVTPQGAEYHDEVVLACHSDEALAMLGSAPSWQRELLAAIEWEDNEVVLHTDTSLLPQRREAWASWNAMLDGDPQRVRLTYNMNILQGLNAPVTFCVSLNSKDRIDPWKILGRYRFSHPLFSSASMAAREELMRNNGHGRIWFCGAWCGNGFHEDGVVSALRVVQAMQEQEG